MTNYNERLDEVLQQNIQFTLLGEFPNAVPDHNNWVNVMGRVYSFDFTEAKQAINSLTKELVAEAKPEKHLVQEDSEIYDDYDHDREQLRHELQENNINIGHNSAIDLYEHKLLKALEEV